VSGSSLAFVPGLAGVPAAQSAISYVDGQLGVLEYRGIRIETLAKQSNFDEVCWLLLTGELPNAEQLKSFQGKLAEQRQLPDRMLRVLESLPGKGHPMSALQASLSALAMFDKSPNLRDPAELDNACVRILAATPVLVAAFDRLRHGKDLVPPDPTLGTAANFLLQLNGQRASELAARVFDAALILHADHTMNASTFAARVVASTEAGPYEVCSSALGALHGPLHGGANEKVLEHLEDIGAPAQVGPWLDARLASKGKVMGFGHRVYKVKDPRANILQDLARDLFAESGTTPLYDTALALEAEMARRVGSKGIYPNVDFFSGIVYAKLGIPTDLFTAVFGISRVAGYLAHWREQIIGNKIYRPEQVYTGQHDRPFKPLAART
jgi:2-methylcitrate synthase